MEGTRGQAWSLIFLPARPKKMKKIIGLTYDLKEDWRPSIDDPADLNAELDSQKTIEGLAAAIESAGHKVKRIGNVHNLLRVIDDLGVDIVFNIAEGHTGRNRESQVPILLELKGIPFVGADALALGLTLDKILAKKCFIADGIPTAPFFEAKSSEDLERLNTIGFPLIVKPRFEGSSKGLSKNSRVEDYAGLKKQVALINRSYKQGALVEKFIKGTEFTVGVIGNEHPWVMPVVQIKIEGKTQLGDDFYTFSRLLQPDLVEYLCPAEIPRRLSDRLQDLAVRVYQCVECRDFGRVDFRVDEKGNPYVLEINPLPCLSTEDVFYVAAKALATTYEEMINRILNFALERYGLLDGNDKNNKVNPVNRVHRKYKEEARR